MIIQIISKQPLRGYIKGNRVLSILVPEKNVELLVDDQRYRIIIDKRTKKHKLVGRHTVKCYQRD